MRISIRWKLVLGIGLPLLLIYGGSLGVVSFLLEKRFYARMQNELTERAGHYAARLDGQFRTYAQVALTTADFLTTHQDITEPELYAMLTANVGQDPLIYGSCIAFEPNSFAPDRRLFAPYVYHGPNGLTSMDVANAYDYTDPKWDWFRVPRTTDEPMWTEPFFDDGAGNIIMCTFVAPFFRDGKFRGTVNIDIPLDKLQMHAGAVAHEGELFLIISRTGKFIVHPNSSFIMNKTIFDLANETGRPDVSEIGWRMVRGESGLERMPGLAIPEPSFVSFARIPSTGWSLSTTVPERIALEFSRSQATLGLGGMLLALAFIGFALLYASKRITRPLEKLAGAVGELSAGNLDAPAVEARTRDEIGDLARAFNQMVKDLKRHVAALTGATRAREAVESELRVARNIQNALLPRTFPPFPHLPQFELHAVNSPARHIAGDFFDFFFVEDDVLVIVMADVSGKGVPAAMFMAVARTIIRNLAPTCPSPGLLLNRANTLLLQDNTESMFVTMFICRYNIKTGRMVYANAGHPKPLVLSSDGEPREFGEITGTVVGALPDLVFTEAAAELKVGERIVMFTDGITEARAPDQHFFRIDGLIELLTRLNHEPVDRLCIRTMQAVTDFQAGEIIDDITILALQRKE